MKHKIILIIDTSNSKLTKVGLETKGRTDWLQEKTGDLKSQNLLPLIKKILEKNKIKLNELKEIKVETGNNFLPKERISFTGLKVGISIVNALGFSLKIPINGKKLVFPSY